MSNTNQNEIEVPIPEDTLTVSLRNGQQELFMSAGMIRELVHYVGTNEDFVKLWVDPSMQDMLMSVVFVPRDEKGKMLDEEFHIGQVQLGAMESKKVLNWIEGHILHFFISNAETAKKSLAGPQIMKLMGLLTGSLALMEQKPSAGATSATAETA